MALTKKDLQAIGELFDQKFAENFDEKFGPAFNKHFDEKFGPAFNKHFDEKFGSAFNKHFDEKFKPINQHLSTIENDIAEIKETTNKNYDMLEEFYVYQKEQNTQTSDILDSIEGELGIHTKHLITKSHPPLPS